MDQNPWIPAEVIRTMTFEWLGLTHTCHIDPSAECYQAHPGRPQLPDEEILEIQDEEKHLIQQLEDLVAEFEAKYIELGGTLVSFLENYWRLRMQEVLKDGATRYAEVEAGMRELGIVLEERDEEESDAEEVQQETGEGSGSEDEHYESADEELDVSGN